MISGIPYYTLLMLSGFIPSYTSSSLVLFFAPFMKGWSFIHMNELFQWVIKCIDTWGDTLSNRGQRTFIRLTSSSNFVYKKIYRGHHNIVDKSWIYSTSHINMFISFLILMWQITYVASYIYIYTRQTLLFFWSARSHFPGVSLLNLPDY